MTDTVSSEFTVGLISILSSDNRAWDNYDVLGQTMVEEAPDTSICSEDVYCTDSWTIY